jgi:hypothetical protein
MTLRDLQDILRNDALRALLLDEDLPQRLSDALHRAADVEGEERVPPGDRLIHVSHPDWLAFCESSQTWWRQR